MERICKYKVHILNMVLLLMGLPFVGQAQERTFVFENGFNAQECDEMLTLNFAFFDTVRTSPLTDFLEGYAIHYRSPNVGLDNACDIWTRRDSTVIIVLRGTTGTAASVLADFYCEMLPARGRITLDKHTSFDYVLATDERAAVHAGFLIGFAYLANDVASVLKDLYYGGVS